MYHKWINDFEFTRTYGTHFRARTWEWMGEWFVRSSKGGPDFVDFTIYERASLRPIGWTNLEDIDHFDRTAKFILLIGEKDCWGKGYGTEATTLMLDYGFTLQGLHNILLTVFSFNERGIRAYTKAGFREIGRRREAHRIGAHAYDVSYMDCVTSDFSSPMLHRFLPDVETTTRCSSQQLTG